LDFYPSTALRSAKPPKATILAEKNTHNLTKPIHSGAAPESLLKDPTQRVYSIAPAFKYELPSTSLSASSSELRYLQHFLLHAGEVKNFSEMRFEFRKSMNPSRDDELKSFEYQSHSMDHLNDLLKRARGALRKPD
jgi:hypothetical protein